jgi:hypothetical protein
MRKAPTVKKPVVTVDRSLVRNAQNQWFVTMPLEENRNYLDAHLTPAAVSFHGQFVAGHALSFHNPFGFLHQRRWKP